MSERARNRWAWALAVASVACMLLAEGLGVVFGLPLEEDLFLFFPVVIGAVSMGVVGALIASRTANPVGWILLTIPAGTAIGVLAETFLDHGGPIGAWYAPLAQWLSTWPFLGSLILLIAVFYLFPSGAVASPRWRWPWRIYVSSAVVTVVGFAFMPAEQRFDNGASVANPLGLDPLEPVLGPVLLAAGITLVVSAFLAFASLVTRYRGADGEERQQLRWLFAVGAAGAFLFATLLVTATATGDPETGLGATINSALLMLLVTVVVVGMPLAVGVAILRYHLYDLNVVVRRAVVVALMTVAITGVYVAIVVAVPIAIRGTSEGGFDLLPLVASVVVAITFDPLRRRARRLADRVVYGERATPYEVLSEFGERVGDTYASDDVLPRMVQILAQGTGAERASVWLKVGGRLRREATWPAEGGGTTTLPAPGDDLPALHGEEGFEVRHRGELLGALSVAMPASEPMDPTKERLVGDLAAQAGLLLRNVRLIEELRASRQRLVAAQDDERRKLERDLHDGAQQQLVALSVQLKLARSLLDRDPAKAGPMLEALQGLTTDALEELRDLARGIFPPLLADRGLAAALEAQAGKGLVPTAVESEGVGRYPRDVESAVYFSCLEALANVAKYAEATRATITLAHEDGRLTFCVTDDGTGFDRDATSSGTGLQGIADRLDAVGGEVVVVSAPGEGTRVSGHVPIGVRTRDGEATV